jgi:hypothetical protein
VFSRETLRTGETVSEAERSLAALIQPRLSRLDASDETQASRPFVGHIDGSRFTFHRIITGVRGFEITVVGRIVEGADGAELRMVFRVAIPVVIFAVASLAAMTSLMSVGSIDAVTLSILAIVVVLLLTFFFLEERRRTLKVLRSAFPKWILRRTLAE